MKNKTTNAKNKGNTFLGNFRISLIFLFIISIFHAQNYTYSGASGGNWNVASNWSGGVIPYIDDTTCNVTIPADIIVNIPSGISLMLESGTVSGAGKIVNNGIFTADTTGSKNFTITTFENRGTFNLGTGSNNAGYISLYNDTVFENATTGELISKGIHFSSSGGNTVRNLGTIKKLGDFSETFNISLENEGKIDVEQGTLIFSGTKLLKTGQLNVAVNATLEMSGYSTLSGIWTGNIAGTFNLNGNNTIEAATTVDNQLSGNGIYFTTGTYSGLGKFINSSIFTSDTTGTKNFTLTNFENKGTFNLGSGTNSAGYIYMYNNTVFENTATGEIIAKGIHFGSSGGNTVRNLGVLKKVGDFEETFNISLENEGEINVEEGTLYLNGTKLLKTGEINVAQNAILEVSGSSTLSGIWTGTIDGTFNLNGTNTVAESTTVENQLSGNGILFTVGHYTGLGKFINSSIFTADTTGNKIFTIANFENKGTFNLGTGTDNAGYISMYNYTAFENLATGEIVSKGLHFGSSGGHTFSNHGIFRKLGNFDETFNVNFDNNGSIIVEEGKIYFSGTLNNNETGIISGYEIGTPSGTNFTNAGTISPGMSPGILNVSGQMKMTGGILEVDLNGMTAGTNYDRVNYTGTSAVNLTGDILINLGFHPEVGSEFVILTSPSAVVTSTLTSPMYVEYDGHHYYFNVTNETNQVKLTVSQSTLATQQATFAKASIYPNPATDFVNYKTEKNMTGYEILNFAGQVVAKGNLQQREGKINLNTLSSGMYILRLKSTDGTENHKLLKK